MQKIFLFICVALLPMVLFAQQPDKATVQNNLETLANSFPQEKVYMQFDKPVYSPGETIWYKAYLMTGIDISIISTNFYVDYTDRDGNVLAHTVIPVENSSAKGSFDIPATYAGTLIHIRAYTKWMLNFDSAFLFEKDITVLQKKSTAAKATTSNNGTATTFKPTIQFFPEGGDCIADINCKIAFKAVYPNNVPCKVSGTVVNTKGQVIAEIKTIHDGMGYFYLQPSAGETYTAKWKDDKNNSYQTPLPAIKKNGVSLEIKLAGDKRGFIIKRSIEAPSNFKQLNIVATMQQHAVYMATVNMDASPVVGGSIPVSQLPSGIMQITLFDSNWVAIAERITFVNNDDYHFDPEVGFATLGTNKRGKNVLVINVTDTTDANLSVAVTDEGVGIDSSDNIISRLLLTGDLKGVIHNPYYYFSDNSDSLQEQLDLVMLTNGWRKIKWEDVLNGKMPSLKYSNDTSYLSLAGKVYGASSIDMRQTGLIFMVLDRVGDSTRQAVQSTFDKNGNFAEPDIILFDTTKIFYQFIGNKDLANSTEIVFNNGMIPSPGKINLDKNINPYNIDTATENRNRLLAEEAARIAALAEGHNLQAVTVTAKTKSPIQILDEKYTSGLFTGGDVAGQFDIASDPSSAGTISILDYLKTRVAGLTITTSSAPGGTPSASWRGGTPDFYLNESPISIDQLMSTPMADIAYVKVFRPPFFGSFGGGANGAVAVYTKRGEAAKVVKGKGLPYKIVIGYAPEKEFYSPNYGTFDQRNSNEDVRSTLYWNPMIITTPKNHMVRLTFYNNDITESFRVIVEGVNKDGKLTHVEKVIE